MAVKEALLPEFDQEIAVTRRVLERVPFVDGNWKPHEKSYSMAALAGHVANIPSWVPITLGADSFNMEEGGQPARSTPASTGELLAEFDGNCKAARESIASADDALFLQPWSLKKGDQVIFTLPKTAVLRSFVLNHLVHHRGQLSVYLRLRDVPVPSIYGPSADEP